MESEYPRIIALDGPAASGKSTLGEHLAEKLEYTYLDTGVMYRAVTLAVLQSKISVDDEKAVTNIAENLDLDVRPPTEDDGRSNDVLLNSQDVTWEIRNSDVEKNVSQISAYKGVRDAMTLQQRKIASRGKVVMVGRDIGTVVLPDADLKIYLDASVEERAKRRFEELKCRNKNVTYEKILADMKKRDNVDSTRTLAPLKPAQDAVVVDSDQLDANEVFTKVMDIIKNLQN